MKRISTIILFIIISLIFSLSYALSEGFFPSIQDAYGVDMPSFSSVVLRHPEGRNTIENGTVEVVYSDVTEAEFDQWSQYIESFGCTLISYDVQGSILSAVIEKQGKKMSFSYDNTTRTVILYYPDGTNEEKYDLDTLIEFHTIGSTVFFGSFEQDGNPENGQERIEWIVLDVQNDHCLLISKYGLTYKEFDIDKNVTWEACSLRSWLNEDFYNTSFSENEQLSIVITTVDNKKTDNHPNDGNNTQDKVFLLNHEEVEQYSLTSKESVCSPTQYAMNQWKEEYDSEYYLSYWWLRSTGFSGMAYITSGGYFSTRIAKWNDTLVRPVIWVNTKSPSFKLVIK